MISFFTSDTSHYENVPFEVPDGWCWCRLDEVADVARGGSPRPIKQYLTDSPDGVNWIKIGDTTEGSKYIETTVEKIIPEGVRHSRMVKEGDFLLTNSMSFGKPFILKTNGCIHDGWLVISPFDGSFDKDYLYYLLSSGFAYDQFSDKASGAVVSNLNKDKVAESLFPLPPFEEQKRIVCQIESIMSFIERMENDIEDVSNLVDRCKSRILNLAIHGKLVPQNASDEPASELLKRINPKAVASCDNPHYAEPYELPDGWTWCKLMDLCTFLSRGKSPKYSETDTTYPVFAQKCNLKDGGISLENARFLDPASVERWPDVYHLLTGDVLVNSTGTGTVGRTRLFNESCLGSYPFVVPDSHVSVVRTHSDIVSEYIFALMSSSWIQTYLEDNLAGSTNQKELYIGVLQNVDVPLPPIMEQRRIADKIESLYQQLDSIFKHL